MFVTILVAIFVLPTKLVNFTFGDSDFTLVLEDVNTTTPNVTKLELDGEAYTQICQYITCKIQILNSSFIPPDTNNKTMRISHYINFNVTYTDTNSYTNDNRNRYFDNFTESIDGCLIYNVIKDQEREIYFCGNGLDFIKRNSDSKSWNYDSIGIYDVKKDTYTIKGDYISDSP